MDYTLTGLQTPPKDHPENKIGNKKKLTYWLYGQTTHASNVSSVTRVPIEELYKESMELIHSKVHRLKLGVSGLPRK